MDSGLIEIDGDMPIYRTFRLKYLLSDLHSRCLTLTHPSDWDDPFENMITKCIFTYPAADSSVKQFVFDSCRCNVFAQCWSLNEESDALWRIYSTVDKDDSGRNMAVEYEGVKLRTTAAKLLSGLIVGLEAAGFAAAFIGSVRYDSEDAVLKRLAAEINQRGTNSFSDPFSHAKSLLWKRHPFSHEQEVRLICMGDQRASSRRTVSIGVDANATFDEMIFDPRIGATDAAQHTEDLRKAGFSGQIHKSTLYQKTIVEVVGFQNT